MTPQLPSDALERLDLWADGQLEPAQEQAIRDDVAARAELGAEARRLERLHDLLLSARVDVEDGFAQSVLSSLSAQSQEQERVAELLSSGRVEVREGFADAVMAAVGAEIEAEDSVAALLASAHVETRPDFTEDVLRAVRADVEAEDSVAALLATARVPVQSNFADAVLAAARGESGELAGRDARWTVAGVAAAVMLVVASVGLLSATGESGLGLLGAFGDFAAMTLLAGAGMLGATWSGVGTTVDAWLGASVANWAVASMIVLGLAFLCARTVRRRRVTVRRD